MYKDQNVVMKFSKSVHSFGNNSQPLYIHGHVYVYIVYLSIFM